MAWIAFDLDGTMIDEQPEELGGGLIPIEGAVETTHRYFNEGHRLTVYTSRFAPMPDSERNRLKEQIEQDLAGLGFPPIEVWAGNTKPSADLFVSKDAVTFDGDYGLAQAQIDYMLAEKGLVPTTPPEQEMGVDQDAGMEDPNV
jgi:hypothetical protein